MCGKSLSFASLRCKFWIPIMCPNFRPNSSSDDRFNLWSKTTAANIFWIKKQKEKPRAVHWYHPGCTLLWTWRQYCWHAGKQVASVAAVIWRHTGVQCFRQFDKVPTGRFPGSGCGSFGLALLHAKIIANTHNKIKQSAGFLSAIFNISSLSFSLSIEWMDDETKRKELFLAKNIEIGWGKFVMIMATRNTWKNVGTFSGHS